MMRVFDVVRRKTETGFGIVFTRCAGLDGGPDSLVVDVGGGDVGGPDEQLRVGDRLIALNGADCRAMPVIAIVELLRAAPCGDNVLRFERPCDVDADDSADADNVDVNVDADGDTDAHGDARPKAVGSSLMDALLKVKSRIKAEIEGDEEELRREQEENALFEKQWLGEFDLLKAEYATRWETCTYTAEEFCGLIYHSSDAQAQQRLLACYPTLMEAWRDADATTSSLRQRLEWPIAKVAYAEPLRYQQQQQEVEEEEPVADDDTRQHSPIQCSPSLQSVLAVLRSEFLWSRDQLEALAQRLERARIYSCRELLDAMAQRNGARFEREFQSTAYPRLTRAVCRALQRCAAAIEQRDESLRDATMTTLRVNP